MLVWKAIVLCLKCCVKNAVWPCTSKYTKIFFIKLPINARCPMQYLRRKSFQFLTLCQVIMLILYSRSYIGFYDVTQIMNNSHTPPITKNLSNIINDIFSFMRGESMTLIIPKNISLKIIFLYSKDAINKSYQEILFWRFQHSVKIGIEMFTFYKMFIRRVISISKEQFKIKMT